MRQKTKKLRGMANEHKLPDMWLNYLMTANIPVNNERLKLRPVWELDDSHNCPLPEELKCQLSV